MGVALTNWNFEIIIINIIIIIIIIIICLMYGTTTIQFFSPWKIFLTIMFSSPLKKSPKNLTRPFFCLTTYHIYSTELLSQKENLVGQDVNLPKRASCFVCMYYDIWYVHMYVCVYNNGYTSTATLSLYMYNTYYIFGTRARCVCVCKGVYCIYARVCPKSYIGLHMNMKHKKNKRSFNERIIQTAYSTLTPRRSSCTVQWMNPITVFTPLQILKTLTKNPFPPSPSSVTHSRRIRDPINNSLEYWCCSTCNARILERFWGWRIILLLDGWWWRISTAILVRCRRCTSTVLDPRKAPALPVVQGFLAETTTTFDLRESRLVPGYPVFPIPP